MNIIDVIDQPMDFQHAQPSKISENRVASNDMNEAELVDFGPKISRNQVCPCGSGKKFKYCHGLLDHEQPA